MMPNKSAIPIFGQQQQLQQELHYHHSQHHPHHQHHQQQHQQLLARSSPYGLLQSARRRLRQCSQLPVRSISSRQQQDCKFANSLRKFPVLGVARHPNRRSCDASSRKSLSMVDLSPARVCVASEGCSESCKTSARLGDGVERCSEITLAINEYNYPSSTWTRESRAASLVCRALAINSWRRKREEVVQLRTSLTVLDQSVEHFKIQIVVLRRLLDNENGRVANLAGELHRSRAYADDVAKERDHLKTEKEALKGEVQKQREIVEDRLVTVENLRNELRSLRDQVNLLDKQIEKDREKLLKLTEDKKVLLEKVSTSEALAAERRERAQKAELSLEEMQMRLDAQIALTNSLQEEVQQFFNVLKEKENEKSELQNLLSKIEKENGMTKERLQSSEEMERTLSSRTADLKSQLVEKELKIKKIEVTCNIQLLELNELRERLLRHTEENGWSSRVLQFAGSVVLVPRVILRTLSFFTTGISVFL